MLDDSGFGPDERSIVAWMDEHLGATVTGLRRQPRWRPVWFVDVDRDGEPLELVVRGDRFDVPGVFPLEHEMLVQRLLDEQGIPVPHVYGWCDEPRAFVTSRVPGQPDFARATEAERESVMDDYLEILARMHALDVEPFAAAGVWRAATPQESGALGLALYEKGYRRMKKRPDPFLEWVLAWLRHHPLDNPGRESVVVWDSGQFHHERGKITGVLDIELGHIGDPLMDLAAFRMRDTIMGYGDFRDLYARYERFSGHPVDIGAIQWHHLAFTLSNQLAYHAAMAEPVAGSDYMTNAQWCCETNIFAVEAVAEIVGVELGDVELPDIDRSPVGQAHEHLGRALRTIAGVDEFAQHEIRIAFRLARHLQRFDEIGRQVIDADLDDLSELLGRRPSSWQDGDSALEDFVLADDGRHDEQLVTLFHRRTTRAQKLLGPAGSAMTTHLPIQTFG